MIPIRDENPTRRFPFMTILLIVANVGFFAYEAGLPPAALQQFVNDWAFVPGRFLADPTLPRQIATLFTAMFMHAGWIHLGGNMLYLWIFGNNIEDRLGAARFFLFYLSAGLLATASQTLVDTQSLIPTLGASGAVAGVLGAYLLLYPRVAVVTIIPIFFFFEVARVPAFIVIGLWFVLQLASGVASLAPEMAASGGVAWFAHIGGFVAGVMMIAPLRSLRRSWH